jgi:uncharacterized membrane protein YgcG
VSAPSFGKRGLIVGPPPAPPAAPRRMRSAAVSVGVGALAVALLGWTAYDQYECWPPPKGEPDERPARCFNHSYSHSSSGGHGFFSGGSSGESSVGHASFGGFGHAASGLGSGS